MGDLPAELAPSTFDAATLRLCLRGWANMMAARFGAPVWLVGSALNDPNARDIDVRIVLPDDVFVARYGDLHDFAAQAWSTWGPGRKRWGEDMAKLGRDALLNGGRSLWVVGLEPLNKLGGLNLDFQVEAESFARAYRDKPRERLDELDLSSIGVTDGKSSSGDRPVGT